jgi:superfamily II DNA/RNA helicase/cold shock CspA family protein
MLPSFADLGVPAPLCATLDRRGITEPFPIQAATLPDVLAGRDVAGKAPTGSGKTLAFGLGIARLAADAGPARPRQPRALVLVPTRELAAQVQRELAALIDERRVGPVPAIYGGVGYGPQRRLLARGPSAVVACPGRLEDLVATGDVRLDQVELVVVDEADRMADMGFLPAVRRLLDLTPDGRQTLLFSATLDGDVDALVRRYQQDPVRHEVEGDADDGAAVEHLFFTVPREKRVALAAEVVSRAGPTFVFTRTRHGADRVAHQLGKAGVKAAAIHGRRTQAQRDQALARFTAGRVQALVATDVAARGIHVDGVACVVHFDLPEDPKDYVHRSGRTGRAGAPGLVVSLVPDDGRKAVRALQRQLGRTEPFTDPDLGLLDPSPAPIAGRVEPLDTTASTGRVAPLDAASAPAHAPGGVAVMDPSAERESTPAADTDGERVAPAAAIATDAGRDRRAHGPDARRERRADTANPTPRARRRRHGDVDAHSPRGAGRNGGRSVAGTVSRYDAQRGFGFIARRGKPDVFVHASALGPGHVPQPGERVRFDVAPGRRGQQARNVRRVA